jgi:sphingosine-1-phosphate phosphatase 1
MYLGMHSLLDVIVGVIYALVLLVLLMPLLETFDMFVMKNQYSAFILFPLGFLICYSYPTLKRWSTTRKDTVVALGTLMGFLIGSCLNNTIGLLVKPDVPPLYDIKFPGYPLGYVAVMARSLLGIAVLALTRDLSKRFLRVYLCKIFKQDVNDPISFQKKRIELPLYYLTYFFLGFNVTFTSPYLFRLLNIERDYSFTEL